MALLEGGWCSRGRAIRDPRWRAYHDAEEPEHGLVDAGGVAVRQREQRDDRFGHAIDDVALLGNVQDRQQFRVPKRPCPLVDGGACVCMDVHGTWSERDAWPSLSPPHVAHVAHAPAAT